MSADSDFLTGWDAVAADLGLAEETGRSIGADLLRRHREEQRAYHTPEHVLAVADHLARLDAATPATLVAAWFHDAIYDPTRSDNELTSARLITQMLDDALAGNDVLDSAIAIVEATASHALDANAPPHCDAFLDADLAILGADPDRYDWYATAIRAEYAHLPDREFRDGRAAVLRSFLDRPVLFFTEQGRDRWEDRARRNLAAEIDRLSSR